MRWGGGRGGEKGNCGVWRRTQAELAAAAGCRRGGGRTVAENQDPRAILFAEALLEKQRYLENVDHFRSFFPKAKNLSDQHCSYIKTDAQGIVES